MSGQERKLIGRDVVSPTAWRKLTSDGVYVGADRSAWLYRRVPTANVLDADPDQVVFGGTALLNTLVGVGDRSKAQVLRRNVAKGGYRPVHLLATNIPQPFVPPRNDLAGELRRFYPPDRTPVPNRVVSIGVPLLSSAGLADKSLWGKVVSVAQFLAAGASDVFDRDAFAGDLAVFGDVFTRAGLTAMSSQELRQQNAWWNWGRWTDTPILRHMDHLHVATEASSIGLLETLSSSGVECDEWARRVPGHHALSYAAVYDWEDDTLEAADPRALWASRLFQCGAVAISVRGLLEPSKVTRMEIERSKKRVLGDMQERADGGKLQRIELADRYADLEAIEAELTLGRTPTVIDARVTVAFNGSDIDWERISQLTGLSLRPLDARQGQAHSEMQPTSPVRANPHLHDVSAGTLAYAGFGAQTDLGDAEGALMGWTAGEGRPVYLSPDAASAADSAPAMLVAGATGSGKTALMQKLAWMFSKLGRPVIVVNPKQGDSIAPFAEALGGQVVTIDSLVTSDGALDPFRYAGPNEAPSLALSFLSSVNPFGSELRNIEVTLAGALRFGAERGAKCTVQALEIAHQHQVCSDFVLSKVVELYNADPMFRLGCGRDPFGEPLRTTSRLTLIETGNAYFDIPQADTPFSEYTLPQRVSMAALRLLVLSSGYALANRGGVVFFDEAWILMTGNGARSELDRLGRLARSWNFLPVLLTQRVQDAVRAELTGFFSRIIGLALPREEAAAACELMRIQPAEWRVSRWAAPAGDPDGFRAYRDGAGRVVRGSRCYLMDLRGRVGVVEIDLPGEMLKLFSTNFKDREERRLATGAPMLELGSGKP